MLVVFIIIFLFGLIIIINNKLMQKSNSFLSQSLSLFSHVIEILACSGSFFFIFSYVFLSSLVVVADCCLNRHKWMMVRFSVFVVVVIVVFLSSCNLLPIY